MIYWCQHIQDLQSHLNSLSVRGSFGEEIENDAAFERWQKQTRRVYEERKTVYLIGNGASASMASHFAADLAKNAHVHTEVFSDLSLITAIANDMTYDEIFAEPLRRRMIKGDMLVAISSSGQSANILQAVTVAKEIGGSVITVSAMQPDNELRSLGMLNFYVPAATYGMAETCHATILHYWMDMMAPKTEDVKPQNQVTVVEL